MDVFLFTVTAAACCLYQFAAASQKTKKKKKKQQRGCSSNDTTTPRCSSSSSSTSTTTTTIIETKPLPHLVQDWIRDFPHLKSSLLSRMTPDDTTTHQPQPQPHARVIGLLIDTNNSHDDYHGRDATPLSFILEKAVAVVNHAQVNGSGGMKIVYIANDWADENENESSVDSHNHHHHHHHDFYKSVSFGLSAFTTPTTDDCLTFQQFLQVCVRTVMEMIGMKNNNNDTSDTSGHTAATTTLKLVHSVTGKVMTQDGLNHVFKQNTTNTTATATSSLDGSNGSGHARRAANPQDNWIEI